jgi:crotonobetainyl-CoA:carnitine CoA-transferase CaiB-like acyl-CoA transferase
MPGPLAGIKVVEMAGLGAGPFCAMMLADMGAEVIRVEHKANARRAPVKLFPERRFDVLARGRRSLAIDLKRPGAVDAVLDLVARADALIEAFRPGVMERLGLGPEPCLARRPALVYGRMTGWGQQGPLVHAAGHDINYTAVSGVLHAIGDPERAPSVPINLVGDFGGGGLLLAFGIACALLEAKASARGQVVDAAMTDGAALLASMVYGLHAAGSWSNRREDNLLDGGAHFYHVYACADGQYIAIGALEPQFTPCFANAAASTMRRSTRKWSASNGPACNRSLRRCSVPAPAHNGVSCWKAAMLVLRRCWTGTKRRAIPTIGPAGRLSILPASPNPRPHPASALHRHRCRLRPPKWANTRRQS